LFKRWRRDDLRQFQNAMVERHRAQYVPPTEDACQTEELF
jgi:hypothetical protein